jgi:nitrite reductase/ring-hydroxylating ferredoxin subunit
MDGCKQQINDHGYDDDHVHFFLKHGCALQIPMTKAKPLPPNEETKQTKAPRVACDFCQSTYNLKTGEKLQSQEGGGLLGGITKALLGAKESGPLKIYQLGEKNNKIMFRMD